MEKRTRGLVYMLALLPFSFTIIFLPFFPDLIPAHYDISNVVTRWGSRYENLILPISIIALTLFFAGLIRYFGKKMDALLSKGLTIAMFSLIVLLSALNLWFSIKSFTISVDKYGHPPVNYYQLSSLIMGVVLLLLGLKLLVFPCVGVFGIRTNTNLQSGFEWCKSRRLGGLVLILSSLLIIFLNFYFNKDIMNLYITMPIVFVIVAIMLIWPGLITREDRRKENQTQ